MKENKCADIVCSVKYALLLLAGYLLAATILRSLAGGGILKYYGDGLLRLAFSIPAIFLLGTAVRGNGFRFVFSMKGAKEAVFASSAMLLYLAAVLLNLLNISKVNSEAVSMIPAILFFDTLSAMFEELLFRGLLMTAALIRWGKTAKGRLAIMLVAGAAFGLTHVNRGLFGALLIVPLGFGFASIYVYSGNLLIPMLLHAVWNDLVKSSNLLVADVHSPLLGQAAQIAQPIIVFGVIPLFAVLLCVKAKPVFARLRP